MSERFLCEDSTVSSIMTTSQAHSEAIPQIEKSDFSLLRLYIEQEVSQSSLGKLIETIENSNDAEVEAMPRPFDSSVTFF